MELIVAKNVDWLVAEQHESFAKGKLLLFFSLGKTKKSAVIEQRKVCTDKP